MVPMAFDRQTPASLPLPGDEHGKRVLQKPLDRTGHILQPVEGSNSYMKG
jgi:hypothetical protein